MGPNPVPVISATLHPTSVFYSIPDFLYCISRVCNIIVSLCLGTISINHFQKNLISSDSSFIQCTEKLSYSVFSTEPYEYPLCFRDESKLILVKTNNIRIRLFKIPIIIVGGSTIPLRCMDDLPHLWTQKTAVAMYRWNSLLASAG